METKTCTTCRYSKPATEFYARRSASDGLRSQCKRCHIDGSVRWQQNNPDRVRENRRGWYASNREDALETMREWREANRGYWQEWNLRRYNMTADQYLDLLWAQGGVCAICGGEPEPSVRLAVDHDHKCCPAESSCGECVRGLIHRSCNLLLGNAKDDPNLLLAAAAYLIRYEADCG